MLRACACLGACALQATLQCAIDNGCYVGGVWKNPVSLNTGVAGMTYGLYQWGTCMNLKCSPVMAYVVVGTKSGAWHVAARAVVGSAAS